MKPIEEKIAQVICDGLLNDLSQKYSDITNVECYLKKDYLYLKMETGNRCRCYSIDIELIVDTINGESFN